MSDAVRRYGRSRSEIRTTTSDWAENGLWERRALRRWSEGGRLPPNIRVLSIRHERSTNCSVALQPIRLRDIPLPMRQKHLPIWVGIERTLFAT